MSTPDGTSFRFGLENEQLCVRLYTQRSDEICRVIRYDSVLIVNKDDKSNQFNFDGSMWRPSADQAHMVNISPEGVIQNDGESGPEKILSYDGTDPTNGEKMTVRADGFTKVQREKETIFQLG